jgi:hypothetical protein
MVFMLPILKLLEGALDINYSLINASNWLQNVLWEAWHGRERMEAALESLEAGYKL